MRSTRLAIVIGVGSARLAVRGVQIATGGGDFAQLRTVAPPQPPSGQ
jgi:hypothetical protein